MKMFTALLTLGLCACAASGRNSSTAAPASAQADTASSASGKRMAALNPTGPEPHAKPPAIPAAWVARSGSIRLGLAEAGAPAAMIDAAIALAHSLGGTYEIRREDWVLLQFPAASFDRAFGALMGLGEVRHYSQQADNITAEHAALETLRRAADSTLARADSLRAIAVGEKTKARWTREAKRRRAELESLEARKSTLRKRADFARITVNVEGADAAR
jgi:hypothetical protein